MQKDCLNARAVLYPLDELRPSSPPLAAAREHVTSCLACQRFFQDERAFVEWLRPQFPVEAAPAALRERIAEALAASELRPQTGALLGRRRALTLLATALSGAAAAALVLRLRAPEEPGITEVEKALVEDHIRYLGSVARADLDASRVEAVSAWFDGKVSFPVRAPVIPGGTFEGARLCFLFGSRVALLFYEVFERSVSFFVIDGERIDLSGARFERHGQRALCLGSRGGYHVVLWRDAGLVYAMVSDLSPTELTRLAAAV